MARVRHIDGIIVSVTGRRWNPGQKYIKDILSYEDYMKFMIYMAEQLKKEIIFAITRQRWARDVRKWPPLSLNYLRYKQKHNLSTNIWEATGHLKRNLKVFIRGTYLVVGFKRDDHYPNSNIRINKVAQYVEYGGSKSKPLPVFRSGLANAKNKYSHPKARPLFDAVYESMRRDIDKFYKDFKKSKNYWVKRFMRELDIKI